MFINLSIAALVFIAGSASGFSLAQILGANLIVGVVAVALSLLRLTDAFARIVPPQIAIGVFAGTVMAFMWKTSIRAIKHPVYSAPVIGGFLIALAVTRSHLVAVIGAAVVGFVGVVVAAGMPDASGYMALPQMALPAFDFTPSSLVALGLPLLILTVGVGNLQALAVLRSEGFTAPGNFFGLAAGAASLVNSLGGGHPVTIGGSSIAISSGPAAGPKESRFWAIALPSVPTKPVTLGAVPVIAVVQDLLLSYTLKVGALALTVSFKVLVKKTVSGPDGLWSNDGVHCRGATAASGRIANGFLGISCRSCGGWRIGVRATFAGLTARAYLGPAGLATDTPHQRRVVCEGAG